MGKPDMELSRLTIKGQCTLPRRLLEAIEVEYSADERRIHAALKEYTRLRQDNVSDPAEKYATELVLKLLKKRLFSSPAAPIVIANPSAAQCRQRFNKKGRQA